MSFRAIWVVDVENELILFSRRFPSVEKRYAAQLAVLQQHTQGASDHRPCSSSIQGLSDELVVTSLLEHIRHDSKTADHTAHQHSSSAHHKTSTSPRRGAAGRAGRHSSYDAVTEDLLASTRRDQVPEAQLAHARLPNAGPLIAPIVIPRSLPFPAFDPELELSLAPYRNDNNNNNHFNHGASSAVVGSANPEQTTIANSSSISDDQRSISSSVPQTVFGSSSAPQGKGPSKRSPVPDNNNNHNAIQDVPLLVGPWIVCEAHRGYNYVYPQQQDGTLSNGNSAPTSVRSFKKKKLTPTTTTTAAATRSVGLAEDSFSEAGSTRPSTYHFPLEGSAHNNVAVPPLMRTNHAPDYAAQMTLQSLEDLKLRSEIHPLYASRQNILIIALPFHSPKFLAHPSDDISALDDRVVHSDPHMLMGWDAVRGALSPFVDQMLVMCPPIPWPLHRKPTRQFVPIPSSWLQVKMPGGWSYHTTKRRLICFGTWCQALHTMVATAFPYGSITTLAPRSGEVGSVMFLRADLQVDSSMRFLTTPSMEPEALFQSIESGGDRKICRASEMLIVDQLPPESEGSSLLQNSTNSQKPTALSRAVRLLREVEGMDPIVLAQASPDTGPNLRQYITEFSCITVALVEELHGQFFGELSFDASSGTKSSSGPAVARAKGSAKRQENSFVEVTLRVQVTPPVTPNAHWMQCVEDLSAEDEDGVGSIVHEDVFPLPLFGLPALFARTAVRERTDPSAPPAEATTHPDSSLVSGSGCVVEVDETLVAGLHTFDVDVHLTPLPPLKKKKSGGIFASDKELGGVTSVNRANPIANINSVVAHACELHANSFSSRHSGVDADLCVLKLQALHQYAFRRTSALTHPQRVEHSPLDVLVCNYTSLPNLIPKRPLPSSENSNASASSLMFQRRPVEASYSLIPVTTPSLVQQALQRYYGVDHQSPYQANLLPSDEPKHHYAKAMNHAPSDEDLDTRVWIENLLETPGNVLYHLELDITFGANAKLSSVVSRGSADGIASIAFDIVKCNAVIHFFDEVSIVSMHAARTAISGVSVVTEMQQNVSSGDIASSEEVVLRCDAAAGTQDGKPSDSQASKAVLEGGGSLRSLRGSILRQLSPDTLLWSCPMVESARPGTTLSLSALVVVDLRMRSGGHLLQSTLSSTNDANLSTAELSQLTTIVSSANLDFSLFTDSPFLSHSGVTLVDPSIASRLISTPLKTSPSAELPTLLTLPVCRKSTELSTLHEAVRVGVLDGNRLNGEHSKYRGGPPPATIVAPYFIRSNMEKGGYVFWNFSGSNSTN